MYTIYNFETVSSSQAIWLVQIVIWLSKCSCGAHCILWTYIKIKNIDVKLNKKFKKTLPTQRLAVAPSVPMETVYLGPEPGE